MVVHDFAYAEVCFDGYKPPSILEVPGAQGRRDRVLLALEEPLDGGLARRLRGRQPRDGRTRSRASRATSTTACRSRSRSARSSRCAARRTAWPRTATSYRERRDALIDGLGAARRGRLEDREAARRRCSSGRRSPSRSARWARSSSPSACSREAKVAVSPGIGFGENGEGYVRFALIENEHRIRQAVRGIRRFLRESGASCGQGRRGAARRRRRADRLRHDRHRRREGARSATPR